MPTSSTGTLRDVLPSVAASLGVAGFHDSVNLSSSQRAVVVLVDGLGLIPCRNAIASGADAPVIAAALASGQVLAAPFPTTTPVGLASLGTGLDAGCHGLVGASFVLPETGHVLWPLAWKDTPLPVAVQPEPTVFEAATAAGVIVTSVSPRAFENSGLTRAALRGGNYVGADSFGERVARTAHALKSERSLVYAYWGDLDKTGHIHGVGSSDWRYELEVVDMLLQRILAVAPTGTTVVVTADHGMIDTGAADRLQLDDFPELRHDVVHIAGEPRVRHVYVRHGAVESVAATWRHVVGDRAEVVVRDDIISRGWYGSVDPALVDRIGDLVVVAAGSTVLASNSIDSRSSALVGQHGSVSEAETLIPLLTWRT